MNLKNYVIVGLAGILTLFSSCADKVYEGDTIYQGGNANLETVFIEVEESDWKWNDKAERYEYKTNLEIDKTTVEKEAVLVYLFAMESVEVVKNLPFEREYFEDNYIYSERISYDINEGKITFYIENSDKIQRAESLVYYEFKIVIIKSLDL